MKKGGVMKLKSLLFLWGFLGFSVGNSVAQDMEREKEYLRKDSMLWEAYEQRHQEMAALWDKYPEKQDSLQSAFNSFFDAMLKRNRELAMEYASTPSGLKRLYMCRLGIAKEELAQILDTLGAEMRTSFYGKNIREHIRVRQIEESDSLWAFPCFRDDGSAFDWHGLKGRQVLLLYGGLGCMGEDGRKELERLRRQTSPEDLQILVYSPCNSLEDLQETRKVYPIDVVFVSDFKLDDSPMKIKYGTQATPTCFLTDEHHVVKVKCTGLRMDLFDKYIKRNDGYGE